MHKFKLQLILNKLLSSIPITATTEYAQQR